MGQDSKIWLDRVKLALAEIANEERQRTTWLGSDPNIVVTPEELMEDVCSTMNHQKLGNDLKIDLENLLNNLNILYDRCKNDVFILINNSDFENIRNLSRNILIKYERHFR